MPDSTFATVMFYLGVLFVIVLLLFAIASLVTHFTFRRGRQQLANLASPDDEALALIDLPTALQRRIEKDRPTLEGLGFRELVTGVRRSIVTGHKDVYFHALASADGQAVWQTSHWCRTRIFGIPMHRWGLASVIETWFEDGTLLVTTGYPLSILATVPGFHLQQMPAWASVEELWQAHQREVARLAGEKQIGWRPVASSTAYFEKEAISRGLLSRHKRQEIMNMELPFGRKMESRGIYLIDLSAVPADQRHALMEEFQEIIKDAEMPVKTPTDTPPQ